MFKRAKKNSIKTYSCKGFKDGKIIINKRIIILKIIVYKNDIVI